MRQQTPSMQDPASRFRRTMRWMLSFSAVVALVAVVIVAAGDDRHPHFLIATAIGVFGTMALGTFLMSLSFFSAASGHDSDAAQPPEQKE